MAMLPFDKIKQQLKHFERPIYETIIDTLLQMIDSGELPGGTQFPPDKKLAIELGVSHATLAKALNELRRRKVLERCRESGTSVPLVPVADELARTRRKIAVVFDDASDVTFQQRLFLQLHHGLEELNCTMLFYSSGGEPQKQFSQLQEILQDITISGCIVWSILSMEQCRAIVAERPKCYPLIFLDKYDPDLEIDAVAYSNFDCAAEVARDIRQRHIRQCWWVGKRNWENVISTRERCEGLRHGLGSSVELKTFDVDDDAENFPSDFGSGCAVVFGEAILAETMNLTYEKLGKSKPKYCYVFTTDSDRKLELSGVRAYEFENSLGQEAIRILRSRLKGKESCTISHAGKWSVLENAPATKKLKT